MPIVVPAQSTDGELSGLLGLASAVITALSEWGVGLLTLVETVFPPIPSEVILPLAGFLASQGKMNLVLVVVTATVGAYLGALVLYRLGRVYGEERSMRILARAPLLDRNDAERSAAWLRRHGPSAVFFGRLIPGVRSLISLPAGATGMALPRFTLYTLAGSLLWNCLLVGLGAALGSQYRLIDRYSEVVDMVLWGALVVVIGALAVRRLRRRRAAARREPGTSPEGTAGSLSS